MNQAALDLVLLEPDEPPEEDPPEVDPPEEELDEEEPDEEEPDEPLPEEPFEEDDSEELLAVDPLEASDLAETGLGVFARLSLR